MNENENTIINPDNNDNTENRTNDLPDNANEIGDLPVEEPVTAEDPSTAEEPAPIEESTSCNESGESAPAFNWEYTNEDAQQSLAPEQNEERTETPCSETLSEEQPVTPAEIYKYTKEQAANKTRNTILIAASILSLLSITLILGFFSAIALGLMPIQSTEEGNAEVNHVTINTVVNPTPTPPDTEISATVLEDFLHSVVIVKGSDITSTSTGTGVIFSSNGYIITNYHVIENCDTIYVELYGEKTAVRAAVVGFHKEDDVAVIKIDRTDLRAAVFADSDAVRYGEKVYAIGTPEGADYGWSVTQGIVSSPRRELMVYNNEGVLEKKISVVQTDAPVNHGNSGGPLVNVRGEVVGIVTLKRSDSAGMGFALPSDGVLIDVISIIEKGHANDVTSGITIPRPLVGITGVGVQGGTFYESIDSAEGSSITVVDEAYAQQHPNTTFYASKTGVYVSATSAGSDASQHLRRGDIITEVNGNTVSTIYHVMDIVNKYKGGDSITVKYYRNGQYYTVTVTLRPAS